MTKLVLQRGPEPGRVLELRVGLNTVGRAETNDFPIDDPSVSGHHCLVAVQADCVVVRDLDSTNGTFVDGQRVRESPFNAGQTLRLGDVECFWEPESAPVSVPELRPAPAPAEVVLPDGRVCCLSHPGIPAVWLCRKCHRHYCSPCVHHLRIVRGPPHHYCPTCSLECEWIGPHREKKSTLWHGVSKAVASVFRKRQS